jgi:hypothetical protein
MQPLAVVAFFGRVVRGSLPFDEHHAVRTRSTVFLAPSFRKISKNFQSLLRLAKVYWCARATSRISTAQLAPGVGAQDNHALIGQ